MPMPCLVWLRVICIYLSYLIKKKKKVQEGMNFEHPCFTEEELRLQATC